VSYAELYAVTRQHSQYLYDVGNVVREARQALATARASGRRTQCLTAAVEALEGALRTVIWEGQEALAAARRVREAELAAGACAHAEANPGPRVPLRHGSAATEVCARCGDWRMTHHETDPERPWQPTDQLAMALQPDDEA